MTLRHEIKKTGYHQFSMEWLVLERVIPNTKIDLNFQPVIDHYNLRGIYALVHWQAIPKGIRRWGVYDGNVGHYYSVAAENVLIDPLRTELLQIDENQHDVKPTAVILYRNCFVYREGDKLKLSANRHVSQIPSSIDTLVTGQ